MGLSTSITGITRILSQGLQKINVNIFYTNCPDYITFILQHYNMQLFYPEKH